MSKITKKIYYHDTDAGGVVYYANYLKYLEEARTEFFLEKGIDIKQLANQGILFVVRRVEIDYKAPARYADCLDIVSQISKLKNVSLEFTQEIKRADKILVSAKTQIVSVSSEFSPKAMTEDLIEKLA